MNSNPYETPKSDVKIEEKEVRSLWWKIYFVFITLTSIIGMIEIVSEPGAGFVDYIEFLLFICATVGFFGYVFMKQILFPKFWLIYLFVYLFSGIIYESVTKVDMRGGMTDEMYYISMAIGYLITLPVYYALFMYGRKTNAIWKTRTNA